MKKFFRFILGTILAIVVCIEVYAIGEWLFSEDCTGALPLWHTARSHSCPPDKPFYGALFHSEWCNDCDALVSFGADNEQEAKKLDVCPNREIIHKCGFYWSQLKVCPKGTIRERNGSCSELGKSPLYVDKKECVKLSNYYWNRLLHECVLKKDQK